MITVASQTFFIKECGLLYRNVCIADYFTYLTERDEAHDNEENEGANIEKEVTQEEERENDDNEGEVTEEEEHDEGNEDDDEIRQRVAKIKDLKSYVF